MFRLLRYFSIASLISMVLAAIVLGTLHQSFEKKHLLRFGESRNVALVQAFSTGNWPQFRSFAKEAKQLDADTLRRNPDIAGLNKSVREAVRNTPTVRVKIFQLDGRILFSTDSAQIGTNTGKGAGFLSARLGQPSSELAHYDKFSTFDGEFLNRDVLASYIPLRSGADAPIEGVMVIYTDVTELQASDKGDEHLVTLSVVSVLAVLYGFLFFIVRACRQRPQETI